MKTIAVNRPPTWQEYLRKHVLLVAAIVIHVLSVGGLVYAQQAPQGTQTPVTLPADSEFPASTVRGVPTRINVPSLGIELDVLPGAYDKTTDSWTLSGYNAHFATATRPANNGGGNTFIYGHNNRDVFGPMKSIKEGAEARILTDVGSAFYYSLTSIKTVDPTDVSIFTYTGAPILTVQTCTGVWHEQRQLYTFKLVRFEESQKSVAIRNEAERQQLLQTVAAVITPTFQLASPQADTNVVSGLAVAPQEVPQEGEQIPVSLGALLSTEKPLFAQLL